MIHGEQNIKNPPLLFRFSSGRGAAAARWRGWLQERLAWRLKQAHFQGGVIKEKTLIIIFIPFEWLFCV
jgi:hypothetical protein